MPLVWKEDFWSESGPAFSALNGEIFVYQCTDGSWRVWFYHGYATSVLEDKIRNIKSKAEAFYIAQKWVEELISIEASQLSFSC